MFKYILWRIAVMIPTLLVISMLVFTIIQLPPGDFFESQIAELRAENNVFHTGLWRKLGSGVYHRRNVF